MKKVVFFLNLTGKDLFIEFPFTHWVKNYVYGETVYLENNSKASFLRENERNNTNNINNTFNTNDVQINQFDNNIDLKTYIDNTNSSLYIINVDYKNNILVYLKMATTIFLIVENEKQINLSSKIIESLIEVNKETSTHFIFLSKSKIQPKEFIFINPDKLLQKTKGLKNLNQVAFSKMYSKLNIEKI